MTACMPSVTMSRVLFALNKGPGVMANQLRVLNVEVVVVSIGAANEPGNSNLSMARARERHLHQPGSPEGLFEGQRCVSSRR